MSDAAPLSSPDSRSGVWLCRARHRRVLFDDVFDTKWVGWYSTAEKAQAAIDRAVLLGRFRDHPDGFELLEVEIDEVYFE